MCSHPIPGSEFRDIVGWTKGSEWHAVSKDIGTTLEEREVEILLFDNSITQGFGGNRQRVTTKAAMDVAAGEKMTCN